MFEERKTIYLCLAHMSEAGLEQKYVKEALSLINCPLILSLNRNAIHEKFMVIHDKSM